MIDAILGTKQETVQKYTADGQRIPVTRIKTGPCVVIQVKTGEKDGYWALQLGWGEKKRKEIRLDEATVKKVKPGEQIKASQVFKAGDRIKVTGCSKGKGFTGVVKRWGFAGGSRTHGQSDRERSPGSIGQGTRIGRVFKGKKMAGRSGGQQVTVTGLMVMKVDDQKEEVWIKGLVPGPRSSFLIIKKTGEAKNFVSLMAEGKKEIKETEVDKEERLGREKEAEKVLEETKKEKKDAKN